MLFPVSLTSSVSHLLVSDSVQSSCILLLGAFFHPIPALPLVSVASLSTLQTDDVSLVLRCLSLPQ